MSSRRTLILIGAIVIGGLAAFLTLNYVRGVESETAEENQLVDVLVATGPIRTGASADEAIEAGQIDTAKRRRADLPVGVVRRNAEIAGQVAAVDMTGGEIITTAMFVADEDLTGSKSTSLDEGNVAVTISVDEAAGVAGLIQPGDLINIFARVAPEGGEATEGNLGGAGGGFRLSSPSVATFQNVKVLAVGQSLGEPVAQEEDDEAAPAAPTGNSGLITVQLPPEDAAILIGVRDASLYLTLNRPDYEPVPLPFTADVPGFSGESGTSPYPEGDAGTGQ